MYFDDHIQSSKQGKYTSVKNPKAEEKSINSDVDDVYSLVIALVLQKGHDALSSVYLGSF